METIPNFITYEQAFNQYIESGMQKFVTKYECVEFRDYQGAMFCGKIFDGNLAFEVGQALDGDDFSAWCMLINEIIESAKYGDEWDYVASEYIEKYEDMIKNHIIREALLVRSHIKSPKNRQCAKLKIGLPEKVSLAIKQAAYYGKTGNALLS